MLIIILPMVLVQALAAYVFFERHWSSVTRNASTSLAGEISYVIHMLEKIPKKDHAKALKDVKNYMQLDVQFRDKSVPQSVIGKPSDRFTYFEHSLKENLEYSFYTVDLAKTSEIMLVVNTKDGKLLVNVPRKRLLNPTTYIFILWMVGGGVLFLTVAILFLRNQLRAIILLAEAAESFGKGEVIEFKPYGAAEVRRAAQAFIDMKERIRRHIAQRTEMLAGVSHDLRTPLTRMKLALAMMEKDEKIKALERDVTDMEHMVEGYLNFVRGGEGEKAERASIASLLSAVVESYGADQRRLTLNVNDDVTVLLRKQAFRRVLTNIIDNGLRYGKNVNIQCKTENSALYILIDDDGPGIPPDKREAVFSPFVRLDTSRNLDHASGVGLGLSIAKDIVLTHGGTITLEDSPLGGVRAVIRLPV